jgi:hypothetical protein
VTIFHAVKIAGIYDGDCVLEATAHELSRALVSQSPSVACCTVSLSAHRQPTQVIYTDDGGQILDGSAHLKSRAFVSQSASIACYTLPVFL